MNINQIAIVDDDLEDHMILFEYFKDLGIDNKVIFFKNGQEILRYLETTGTVGLLPKLIVLDLNMPILNGSQTLLSIKQSPDLKNIPVIIFSTSENETEKRKCLSLGAMDYMVKPVTYEQGLNVVKRFATFLEN